MTPGAEPAATDAWLRHHYAHGADALDVDGFMRGLADDVELSSPAGTVVGTRAVRRNAQDLFSALTSLTHDIHRIDAPAEDLAVIEATVSYRFISGHQISLPCTTTFCFRSGLVTTINLDIDTSALAAAMAANAGGDPT
jgi:hypothetical protein